MLATGLLHHSPTADADSELACLQRVRRLSPEILDFLPCPASIGFMRHIFLGNCKVTLEVFCAQASASPCQLVQQKLGTQAQQRPLATTSHGGFHKWGYPKYVVDKGKILLKWMKTRGIPISGNLHIDAREPISDTVSDPGCFRWDGQKSSNHGVLETSLKRYQLVCWLNSISKYMGVS